ncbi:MAG: hypothetical protein PVI57_05700 [Gemmatimonadota bacterium]|jgi:hypothetical protein
MFLFDNDRKRHPGRAPFLGALGAWTLLWAVLGIQDVLTQTAIGRGATGGSVEAHEVVEVLFVSAYSGIRWAFGAAVLVLGALVVRQGMRRLSAKR